jgi:hypothetical protein
MKCQEIPSDQALAFWPELEPYVIRALQFDLQNTTSTDKIKRQLETGFARCLVCVTDTELKAVTIVALVKNTLDERMLHVTATAGENAREWLGELVAKLVEIAEADGCDGVTIVGRPGWAKKLNKHGFRIDQVSMRLNIDGRTSQVGRIKRSAV